MNEGVIANLTPEALANLGRLFDEAKSGTSTISADDPTWLHINVLPVYIKNIEDLSGRPPTPFRHWASRNPPADAAFDHAQFALNGARDGLVGLYAQVVKAEILNPSSVFLFTRQICEAALTARWLMEDPTPRGLIRRGFAAAWDDYYEHNKFAKHMFEASAVEPSQSGALREKVAKEHQRLLALGKAHRLLKSGDKEPDLKILTGTALFKSVEGPPPHTDMRWLFNLLSGALHSRTWATLLLTKHEVTMEYLEYNLEGMPQRSAIVHARTDPNLAAMLLPIQVAMLQVHSACNRFLIAESQPAPTA